MRVMMTTLAVTTSLCASVALAKQPLSEVKIVNDGLLAVGIADEIRKNCPSISARMVKAFFYINELEDHAKELGYSEEEIDDYVSDKSEKAKMRARGEAYLKEQGVVESNPDTYCALGRAEIKKSSRIGALLRAK